MDKEGERIRNLIESVEKEFAWEEETRKEAGAVRRQLFGEEECGETLDSIQSDDDDEDIVEEVEHDTDSEQSVDEVEEDIASGPFYTG